MYIIFKLVAYFGAKSHRLITRFQAQSNILSSNTNLIVAPCIS